MQSLASRSPKTGAFFAALGTVAAVAAALGAGPRPLLAAEVPAASAAVPDAPKFATEDQADPFAERFKGIVLKTHEGKTVRFYEDLLQGKIVMINFMYATCKGR